MVIPSFVGIPSDPHLVLLARLAKAFRSQWRGRRSWAGLDWLLLPKNWGSKIEENFARSSDTRLVVGDKGSRKVLGYDKRLLEA